ncbi:MAG TPA: response regulator transcription factor, partial [Streptomyces sp.]|nr:response regulator transcription factor [Streptomyces sp.]
MRVVVVEDNGLLAEGLRLLLSTAGHDVVATVADADGFVLAAREHSPDMSIVDVRLPPGFKDEGVRAALAVCRFHPGLPILVLSQYVEETYAAELLADGGGGVGYLLKDRVARVGEFLEALERVSASGTAMDPEVVAQLVATGRDPMTRLTARERAVLELMAQGYANAEMAARLF